MEGKGIDHPSAVDLMTGVMGGLLPKLVEFLKQEHNLQTTTTIKKIIESLEIHLRRMEDALVVRIPPAQQDQVVVDPEDVVFLQLQCNQGGESSSPLISLQNKHCAYELRELAYDIEDIVDNLMRRINQGKQKRQPIINQDSFSRETLENIKVRVKNLAAWRDANFVAMTSTVEPCLEDGFVQVRQLIGIHKLRDDLVSRMSSPSQQLKIVSIWGAGGMGKTTLAKAVYENIKGNFQCAAFVSVGPQPDTKKVLRDILIQLDKKRYSDLNMAMLDEGHQLIVELQHFVKSKRFLIVIDDIRDIPSWEVIKCALVDNGYESRIITTSRVLGIAESSGEVLKMMPLSIDGSKELFYATLCGRKATFNFDSLDEQTTESILQKCGGVPLAIIMIASLLACKSQEEWSEVHNSIGFGQEDNIDAENNTRKIIQFSYYDLPSHLKTCLLYLSIFPDGHVIEKDMLVWRWVAEGFVHDDKEQTESVFKVGERYLYELVSTGMILAVENGEDTSIYFCNVEGMVLDWIRTVANEEKFVTTVSGDSPYYDHDEHHRSNNGGHIVAVQNSSLSSLRKYYGLATWWKPKVRSFNGIGCHINEGSLMVPVLAHCRVLSLEGFGERETGYNLYRHIAGSFLHLRYLVFGGLGIFRHLPIEIGRLRYLQTLDLTDTTNKLEMLERLQLSANVLERLPLGVTGLRHLKCLRCFPTRMLDLPKGMGNLTSLEELQLRGVCNLNVFVEELNKLKKLRVFRIHAWLDFHGNLRDEAALVESLSKLQKMEVLEVRCMGTVGYKDRYYYRSVVRSLQEFAPGGVREFAPGAFPKLRYMKMDTWLMYQPQPGAMPRLKSVELVVRVRALKDDANFDFDFHNLFCKLSYLRLLEKAHVRINCLGAKMEEAEEAEAALRRAVESHPNRPKLILNRVGRCVDDEKQIRSFRGLHGSRLAPQVMPLELLRKITNDFSEKQILGSGTFGTVYKGDLDGKEVAVKLLHSMSQRLDYEKDFMKEFENLSRLNHANIVQLLGYCYEIKRICVEFEGKYVLADKIDRALCFDYMPNGSLQRHLDDESRGLDWQTRYKIIKGTCEGLKYLHKGLENPMFHLDLKPGNILLDKNMVPKLADFGLSKLVCDNQTQATSNFLGTIGYCPPEHIERYFFSDKFDIFSLGVVMIEIIAGPKGYCKAVEMSSQGFIDHVQENWSERIRRANEDEGLFGSCLLGTPSPRQGSQAFDFGHLGPESAAWQAGGGEGVIQTSLNARHPAGKACRRSISDAWGQDLLPGRQMLVRASSKLSPECHQVKRCIEIALECVHPERMQRPDIEDVISRLKETENNTEESATTSSLQNET